MPFPVRRTLSARLLAPLRDSKTVASCHFSSFYIYIVYTAGKFPFFIPHIRSGCALCSARSSALSSLLQRHTEVKRLYLKLVLAGIPFITSANSKSPFPSPFRGRGFILLVCLPRASLPPQAVPRGWGRGRSRLRSPPRALPSSPAFLRPR